MKAYQASERGGELFLELAESGRVYITGNAVTILKGTLLNDYTRCGNPKGFI